MQGTGGTIDKYGLLVVLSCASKFLINSTTKVAVYLVSLRKYIFKINLPSHVKKKIFQTLLLCKKKSHESFN